METTVEHRTLVRPKDERWLGGVCVGLGRYFDLNAAVYRIAFAALAFAGGTGIFLYLAAWLVIPEEGAADSIAAAYLRRHRGHPKRLLGLAVLAAIALAVVTSIRVWPSPADLWLLAAVLLTALLLARGRVVIGILAGLLVAVVAATVIAVRVPLFAGVGERVDDPAAAADVRSAYELGVGKLELDFAGVTFPRGQTFVKARLGVGELRVYVPASVSVRIAGRVAAGDLDLLGRHWDGTAVEEHVRELTGSGRVLVLDLRTGVGHVLVERR